MGTILVLKLVLVPALIAGITFAGRRWGPAVAGWLSAFPVVSGPILGFMAIEHGPAFAATAATGTLSAVLAILAFGIAYAWAATRCGWRGSLAVGFAGYAVAVECLRLGAPTLWVSVPIVMAALLLAPGLYPAVSTAPDVSTRSANDLAPRMLAGAVLVCSVTHFAATMGPALSGVFAMFPVMGSVIVVFSHRQSGAAFAIRLLRGMVLGYYAFVLFCVVLATLLPVAGIAPSFACAFVAALAVQAGTRLFLQRRLGEASQAPLVPVVATSESSA